MAQEPTSSSFPPFARAAAVALPFLLGAYVVAPGHPLATFRGVPLDAAGLLAGSLVATIVFAFGWPRPGRATSLLSVAAAGLLVAKVALAGLAPSYGLEASYFPRARFGGAVEPSTEFRGAPFTRIDRALDGNLALHFFNDVERFNFYDEGDPPRERLPFAVRWDGVLHPPREADYDLTLTATGSAALFLDGRPLLTVPAGSREGVDRTSWRLGGGAVPIRVEYVYTGGAAPMLRVDWDPGDGSRPLGAPFVTPAGGAPPDLRLLAGAHGLDVAFGLVLFLFCAFTSRAYLRRRMPGWAERPLLAGYAFAFVVYAVVSTWPLVGRSVILEGGQDWLTYESYARDILLNGPLMTLGKPLGKGRPFFFQPFYPYYLAGLHWLAGEGLWGPIVLQVSSLGVVGVLVYLLARRLAGIAAAAVTLVLYTALCATQLEWVARKLLSENLYFMLLPGAVLAFLRLIDGQRLRDAAAGGVLVGLGIITRAPTLLYVPFAVVVLARGLCRAGLPATRVAAALALIVSLAAAVAALVPLRNYVVSGRPALVATNGGATLLLAHTPTDRVRLSGVDRDPVYNLLGLDRPTREVLEFARQDPSGYLASFVPLALYTVGYAGAVSGTVDIASDMVAITVLYLGALAALPATRSLRALLAHGFIGLHFLVMITFLPYVYGYRQVLPMTLLMLPFAGWLLARTVQRLMRHTPAADPSEATLVQQHAD